MPVNRNALIRYRTINELLSTGRRYSIDEILDSCNEALCEFCGPDTSVSERTIRDDIRVMRSNALGLNAPIAVKEGLYHYTDRNYSLKNLLVADDKLIEELLELFRELRRNNEDHSRIDQMISRLNKARERAMRRGKMVEWDDSEDLSEQLPGTLIFYRRMPEPDVANVSWEEVLKYLL